jgi:hypothetical protein
MKKFACAFAALATFTIATPTLARYIRPQAVRSEYRHGDGLNRRRSTPRPLFVDEEAALGAQATMTDCGC